MSQSKKLSPLLYVLGAIFISIIGAIFGEDFINETLVRLGCCLAKDIDCLFWKKVWSISIFIGIGLMITGYKYTLGDESFRIRFAEFFSIPKSINVKISPHPNKKHQLVLKMKNSEWRSFPKLPLHAIIKPVGNYPEWDIDFLKLDFVGNGEEFYRPVRWLGVEKMDFIRFSPSKHCFYIMSKHVGDKKFSAFKSHEFLLKVYSDFKGVRGVIQEAKIVVNYKGGHVVDIDIQNDYDNSSSVKRSFHYNVRDFSNRGGV